MDNNEGPDQPPLAAYVFLLIVASPVLAGLALIGLADGIIKHLKRWAGRS